MSNEIQGEMRTRPRKGVFLGSVTRGMEVSGWGWMMCERRETARFAPAESPVMMMFRGEILRVWVRWFIRLEACWSWRGYWAPGARSGDVSLISLGVVDG